MIAGVLGSLLLLIFICLFLCFSPRSVDFDQLVMCGGLNVNRVFADEDEDTCVPGGCLALSHSRSLKKMLAPILENDFAFSSVD